MLKNSYDENMLEGKGLAPCLLPLVNIFQTCYEDDIFLSFYDPVNLVCHDVDSIPYAGLEK
jgi:hypothetical protein